jgi:hypothetical protein
MMGETLNTTPNQNSNNKQQPTNTIMMDNWGIHSHEKVSMPLETLLAIS